MPIKEKTIEKYFFSVVVIIGIIIPLIAGFYFFKKSRTQTELNLRKIVNYMSVQCSSYDHYNEGSETQALLREIESCGHVRESLCTDMAADSALNEDLLKKYADHLWLSGIVVMDADGNVVCRYDKDHYKKELLDANLKTDIILEGFGYPERTYSQRINFPEGDYLNVAATSRKDADGVILTYYYIEAECAREYSLTLQSLILGYEVSTDGTIMITDEGEVIASNDDSLIGTNVTDNEIIQILNTTYTDGRIMHIKASHSYGMMHKQSNYYIYACVPDTKVFSVLLRGVFTIICLYICVVIVIWILLRRTEREYLTIERMKEEKYREQLMEVAQRAETANVAKTRFLQRMSHDIRTPINGICGMLEVADYYADDLDKQAECRSKIRETSHLLLELVNEVLDMGKLEAGEMLIDEQAFNIHKIFQDVLVVIEKMSDEQDIELIKGGFDVSHCELIGCARYVKRVLMNIMSNAVKYNKKQGSITIKCRELPSNKKDKVLIEFICEDTGIGMSEEYSKRIFEPFTQEVEGARTKYGGSGLGMPITKGLVDNMGGIISFESKEGKGTTFFVTIPFKINTQKTVETKVTTESSKMSVSGYSVMLVEDNDLNMEIAEFILQKEGIIVRKAWNGKEAVEIFKNSRNGEFDAIIMDVMMPVMDGYTAAKEIRKLPGDYAKNIPIIAMTANAFTDDRIKSREAGMNAHISKPIDVEVVIETLYKLINKK